MDLDHNKLGRYGSPIKLWGKKSLGPVLPPTRLWPPDQKMSSPWPNFWELNWYVCINLNLAFIQLNSFQNLSALFENAWYSIFGNNSKPFLMGNWMSDSELFKTQSFPIYVITLTIHCYQNKNTIWDGGSTAPYKVFSVLSSYQTIDCFINYQTESHGPIMCSAI